MPGSSSQRARQSDGNKGKKVKEAEKPPKRPAETPAATKTESKLVKANSTEQLEIDSVVMDLSDELNKGDLITEGDKHSPLAKELLNVLPVVLPTMIDQMMDKIMPKIMDAFEKVNFKQAERTDELAVKMETVVNRVENIRNADNLRTMIEIDRIYQVQKDKTLRIIGLPEDRDIAEFVSNIGHNGVSYFDDD